MFKSIITLLLLTAVSFAGNNFIFKNLLLSCDFETGYIPKSTYASYTAPSYFCKYKGQSFYVSLCPSISFKGFYTDFKYTYFASKSEDRINFSPYRGIWENEIGFTYNVVTIGYSHICSHSITPLIYNPSIPLTPKDESVDKLFLKLSINNKRHTE